MNADQLAEREPIHQTVCATLQRHWSQQVDGKISISAKHVPSAEEWRFHTALTTYIRPSASRQTRLLVSRRNKHTRSRRRLLTTYLDGTWKASRAVVRYRKTTDQFWVDPGIPGSNDIFIVPGNQKLRIFDLSSGSVSVVVKAGFASTSLASELLVRDSGIPGPYLPVLSTDRDGQWIEEPLVEGYSLDILPRWRSVEGYAKHAVAQLADWLTATSVGDRSIGSHFDCMLAEAENAAATIDARYSSSLHSRIMRLMQSQFGFFPSDFELRPSLTHGDMQLANIMVPDCGEVPVLVDWENASYRDPSYDFLVLGLGMRSTSGREERIREFVESGTVSPLVASYLGHQSRGDRVIQARLCLVEDLMVRLRECTRGIYLQVPASLLDFVAEFERLASGPLR